MSFELAENPVEAMAQFRRDELVLQRNTEGLAVILVLARRLVALFSAVSSFAGP